MDSERVVVRRAENKTEELLEQSRADAWQARVSNVNPFSGAAHWLSLPEDGLTMSLGAVGAVFRVGRAWQRPGGQANERLISQIAMRKMRLTHQGCVADANVHKPIAHGNIPVLAH